MNKDILKKEEFQKSRYKFINSSEESYLNNKVGNYIALWLQSSIRIRGNYTLEYGLKLAQERGLPIYIFFKLNSKYKEANYRSFKFLIEGLSDLKNKLEEIGLKLNIIDDSSFNSILEISKEADILITDKLYLREGRDLNQEVSKKIECPMVEVEGNVVVPVEIASDKEEFGAYTIRGKIERYIEMAVDIHREEFYSGTKETNESKNSSHAKETSDLKKRDYEKFIKKIGDKVSKSGAKIINSKEEILNFLDKVERVSNSKVKFKGGEVEAWSYYMEFQDKNLAIYSLFSNSPSINLRSHISPYLHFGHISPLDILIELDKILVTSGLEETLEESLHSFREELVVRRELAFNFCYYNCNYDKLMEFLPDWAIKTIEEHRGDSREYDYTLEELESYNTHDKYWNEAMREMVEEGTMNSYMRMYWGKKILEWSKTAEEGYNRTILLNNRYFLDGRDPNSYAGVAWCYGKHDRAWTERKIFGKIRYMNSSGVESKSKKSEKLLKKNSNG